MPDADGVQGLKIVDAFDLDDELRSILRPGEMVRDDEGTRHRLPRYFYEVPSREEATGIWLAPNFRLSEFMQIDIRETSRLQEYPKYIPCAVRVLAFYLQRVREAVGLSMHVAVNGGYRSPAHRMAAGATCHMWGTAVDIYRVGTTILREEESITKYNRIAEDVSDDLRASPYGHTHGFADDHIHLDLGYVMVTPREISEDRMEVPQESPRFAYEDRRRSDRRASADPKAETASDPA